MIRTGQNGDSHTNVLLDHEKEKRVLTKDISKRIELINLIIENLMSQDVQICELMESKINEIILPINQTHLMSRLLIDNIICSQRYQGVRNL